MTYTCDSGLKEKISLFGRTEKKVYCTYTIYYAFSYAKKVSNVNTNVGRDIIP